MFYKQDKRRRKISGLQAGNFGIGTWGLRGAHLDQGGTILEAADRAGKRLTLASVRQSSHRSRTAEGEIMMFLTLEYPGGMLDVILFPNVYGRAKSWVNSNVPMLVSRVMKMDTARSEPHLRAEKVERVE